MVVRATRASLPILGLMRLTCLRRSRSGLAGSTAEQGSAKTDCPACRRPADGHSSGPARRMHQAHRLQQRLGLCLGEEEKAQLARLLLLLARGT